jgi:SAM-dependent methyltransferase
MTLSIVEVDMSRACIVCASTSSSRFKARGRFEVRRCDGCRLRFLSPQPTAAELDELYGESYFQRAEPGAPGYDEYLKEIGQLRAMFDHRVSLLESLVGGRRLLDVGAAAGLFVERARQRGWDASGVEPSQWASAQARERFGQPVATGILRDLQLPDGQLDVVTMWEVIEHLPEPLEELREIRRVLSAGGHLTLSTPDAGALVSRSLGSRWPGWGKVPEHLWFFDKKSLGALLSKAGFEVVTMKYVPLVVSVGYFLDRVSEVTSLPLGRLAPSKLKSRSIRVNPLFDLFTVARAV